MDVSKGTGEKSRGNRRQAAALIVAGERDQRRVCLITSRDTGRWIVPKGKVRRGEEPVHCAEREALEEAGVIACAHERPLGLISAEPGGVAILPLYLLEVAEILDDWPERSQRRRAWETLDHAAEMVDDPNLVEVLLNL